MKKIKFVVAFSLIGFLFSLVIGLYSRGVGTSWAFLRAFLFALLFAGLGFLLSVLFEKFVDSEVADEGLSPSSSEMGQKVDLVTPDEPLSVDDNASSFSVGSKHQMLNNEDYYSPKDESGDSNIEENQNQSAPESNFSTGQNENQTEQKTPQQIIAEQNAKALNQGTVQNISNFNQTEDAKNQTDAQSGFIPISLQENAQNISSVEAKPKSDYLKDSGESEVKTDDSELDALPDLQELQEISEETAGEQDQASETFEEVAKSVKSTTNFNEGQDVSLIAKAISTVLTKDR